MGKSYMIAMENMSSYPSVYIGAVTNQFPHFKSIPFPMLLSMRAYQIKPLPMRILIMGQQLPYDI